MMPTYKPAEVQSTRFEHPPTCQVHSEYYLGKLEIGDMLSRRRRGLGTCTLWGICKDIWRHEKWRRKSNCPQDAVCSANVRCVGDKDLEGFTRVGKVGPDHVSRTVPRMSTFFRTLFRFLARLLFSFTRCKNLHA